MRALAPTMPVMLRLELSRRKKIEAARMLGLKSHQVLNNRLSPRRGSGTGGLV